MSKVKIFLFLQVLFFSALPVLAQGVFEAWVARYNGGIGINLSDVAYGLAVDGSGNVYVTGAAYDSTDLNYTTIKYSPSGDTLWLRSYNGATGTPDDVAYGLAVDGDGNVYVTGWSTGLTTDLDYTTIKYASNGDTLWIRHYDGGGNGIDQAFALAVDDSGAVYVTGQSIDSGGTNYDYATIKYSPNGDSVWVRRYNGPGNGFDRAIAIGVDGNGNVYVTGWSIGSGTSYDYATIKYAPNGATVWVRRYNGPANAIGVSDQARALAVDDSGNVYVTGYSIDSSTSSDYTTIMYAPNGDTVWVRRYNGPGNSFDDANALAIDNGGNIYVTGRSLGSGTSYDYATIKYAPNGDTAWVRRYNGPGNGLDHAYALAIDAGGNIYVTGQSVDSVASSEYATIKYAPNGDTVWVRRYNGPGDGLDAAYALAIDDGGNIYVTGKSRGSGTDDDYATIKYSLIPPQVIDSLKMIGYSPINLVVTDPKNDSIGLNFNTILEGSTYDTTQDVSVPPDGEKDDVVRIPNPYVGEYKIRVVPEDTGHFSLGIRIDGSDQVYLANNVVVPETSTTYEYSVLTTLRGDVNKDAKRNLADIIFLVNYVFKGGPTPDPKELGDVNCSGGSPILPDVIYMVNYVFKGGKAPCS